MPDPAAGYEKSGHIGWITLNTPRSARQLAYDLEDISRRVRQDPEVYVAVLTGSGDVFCAGRDDDPAAGTAGYIAAIEQPVIAAVNGDALGEGLELALSADIRLASERARFGLPQVKRGMMPGDGGTQRLPRVIGKGKALEMIMTGDNIDAKEALRLGLVSRIVSHENLAEETRKFAEALAGKAPLGIRYVKEAVTKGLDLTMEQGLRLEADLYFLLHTTADRTEGIRAFLEKRPPQFKNE